MHSVIGRIKIREPGFPVATFPLPSTLASYDTFHQEFDVDANQPLALVGSTPSSDSNDWNVFFLEPRANRIGRARINFCRDLGYNCGYVWPPGDGMSCGVCGAGEVCGSSDKPQVCRACTPATCATANAKCGQISD